MGTVSHQMFTKADFLTLIGYLVQESANLTEFTKVYKHNAVAQFTQTLTDDLTDKIYLSDLALQTGMSPAHMRKLFHKVNNVSPREYLINTRIEKAKFLLEEGKMSISEIGREIGYPNVNYFSRIFKSKTKMSPTDYSKSLYEDKENNLDPKFYWCDLATKGREQESSSKKNDKKSEK